MVGAAAILLAITVIEGDDEQLAKRLGNVNADLAAYVATGA